RTPPPLVRSDTRLTLSATECPMAKKTARSGSTSLKARDKVTLGKLTGLADDVAKKAFGGREPKLEIPSRTRSNTLWNKRRKILEMGDATQDRELLNLNQGKQFMQTMIPARSIKDLIDQCK